MQYASKIYFISLSSATAGDQAVRKAVCLFRCHNVEIQYWADVILTIFEDPSLKIWPQHICGMKSCCNDFSFSAVQYMSEPTVK